MKYLLALLAVCLATTVHAQDSEEDQFFLTRQGCEPALEMMQTISQRWGEQPLFIGTSIQFGIQGEPFQGGSMFFVNQDTGSWSLITMYGDGTACMTAVGNNFEPYTD